MLSKSSAIYTKEMEGEGGNWRLGRMLSKSSAIYTKEIDFW